MNYQSIYDNICIRGQSRILSGYKEVHHVIPRCMGGSDDIDNLTSLSAKEHFIVHRILCKLYPDDDKLKSALFFMTNMNHGHITSSRIFEELRVAHGRKMRKLHTGKTQTPEHKAKRKMFGQGQSQPMIPSFLGRTHTNETKIKISQKKLGCISPFKGKTHTQESNDKNRQAHLGKKHTDAQILNQSKTYEVISPLGVKSIIVNLTKFCRERGLAQGNMANVSKGIKSHCKGWKCKLISI